MVTLITKLFHDDAGFIISAELILISTILVLGMVVGLSEVSYAVNEELEDVASAFGSVNQSYRFSGAYSRGKGSIGGSGFHDNVDLCDSEYDIAGNRSATGESGHHHHGHGRDE